jgi:outer membrane protein assembly factor BamB
MIKELGIFKRDAGDMCNPTPSPLCDGNRLYCITGNGSRFGVADKFSNLPFVPFPDAPSFIALHKNSGELLWKNAAPGKNIFFGQWASPALLEVENRKAVIFPGGDGWLYALSPESGKVLGSVNLNTDAKRPWTLSRRGDALFCMHKPLVVGNEIYLGLNQDQEASGSIRGPLVCIDGKALVSNLPPEKTIRWKFENPEFDGVTGELASHKNLLFAVSRNGILVAIQRSSGRLKWHVDLREGSSRYPGITVADDKIYVPTADSIWEFAADDLPRPFGRYKFNNQPCGKPIVSGNHLFVTTSGRLWCLRRMDMAVPADR